MSGTDSDIDLTHINRPIYIENIIDDNVSNGKINDKYTTTKRCIENPRDKSYKISRTSNDIDYYKYFIVRQIGIPFPEDSYNSNKDIDYDLSDINVSDNYIRENNVNRSDDTDENIKNKIEKKWNDQFKIEEDFLKSSMIASLTFKYMSLGYKAKAITYEKILNDICGCFFVYPYIEEDKAESNKYYISYPNSICVTKGDEIKVDSHFFEMLNTKTFYNIIEKKEINIVTQNNYSAIESAIDFNLFNESEKLKNAGVNFIDGINTLIDHQVFNIFASIISNPNQTKYNTFLDIIYKYNDIKSNATGEEIEYSDQVTSEELIGNIDKIKPLHIIPKQNNIENLREKIEAFVQNVIDEFYIKNIPKIYRTNTNFICKKMIINSIYFTSSSHSISDNLPNIDTLNIYDKLYVEVLSDQKRSINNNINDLRDKEKLAERNVNSNTGKTINYYFFTIQVKFPICNSHPIRSTLADAVINNNVIIIILSYLIGILLHGAVSCCLEFWLNYGDCIENIYVTNTCRNIGDGKPRISLIDNLFKWRLTNFPYKKCDGRGPISTQVGGEIVFNKKKFFYPAVKKKNTICLKENIVEIHKNKRPFPYSLIDYGEENFDSESIKIFFRYIVTLILLFILPFRFFFNKFLTKSSDLYRKYVAENKLLSSLVFVLLPLYIPILIVVLIISLIISFILFSIYIIISLIHNTAHIFSSLNVRDNNEKHVIIFICNLLGIILSLVSIYYILALMFPCRDTNDNGNKDNCLFHTGKLSALVKCIIIASCFIVSIIFFAIKSYYENVYSKSTQLNKMEDFLKNEIQYSETYFNWLYKLLFSMFDYDKLDNEGKEELTNYRVTHYVARDNDITRDNDIKKQPLRSYLKTDNVKFSIKRISEILLILLIVILFIGDFEGISQEGKSRIIAFAVLFGLVLFFYINVFLKKLIFSWFKEVRENGSKHNPLFKDGDDPFTTCIKIVFGIIFCDVEIFYKCNNYNYYSRTEYYTPSIVNFNDKKLISNNSLICWYKKILDLSEFILLLKKILYIFCSGIVMYITLLAFPIVLSLTLIFICLNLLYIFFIVPFSKGGHFFFKIMKNRYKILTYMLCVGVIFGIRVKQIFGNNTDIVVATMSGILGILIIYDLINS